MNNDVVKRFIIAIILFFVMVVIMRSMTGCCPSKQQNSNCSKCNTKTEVVNIDYGAGTKRVIRVGRFEHNGHNYLVFGQGEGRCVVHDPDCEKCKYNSNSEY